MNRGPQASPGVAVAVMVAEPGQHEQPDHRRVVRPYLISPIRPTRRISRIDATVHQSGVDRRVSPRPERLLIPSHPITTPPSLIPAVGWGQRRGMPF